MSLKQGFIAARSSLVFIAALVTGTALIFWLENLSFSHTDGYLKTDPFPDTLLLEVSGKQTLTAQEMAWAEVAWSYFEKNLQPETGLVNSVNQFPATTMWDTASYLMALISAEKLELIPGETFDMRMSQCLQTLATMPLFDNKLPNKSYNTINAKMVDYQNNDAPLGIGWSAIDICRIMVPLQVLIWQYPKHTDLVRQVVARWQFDAMVDQGVLWGALRDQNGEIELVQEGRQGYEEYAGRALQLLGMDVMNAMEIRDFLDFKKTYEVNIAIDTRAPEVYEARNYIVSEPYILGGIEFGWGPWDHTLASRVYLAQENRYKEEGILTAVSEDHIDRPPYFVYNAVFSDGKLWTCLTELGEEVNELKTLSTKTAFGWYALFDNDYTNKLVKAVADLGQPSQGFYAGRYEADQEVNKSLAANTNGIILEALCYREHGPFLRFSGGGALAAQN